MRAAAVLPCGTTACVGVFAFVGSNGLLEDEAASTQRSLFSQARFMAEEPVKPKMSSRKPKPAAASLFEWALALEQDREREAEPVGAGR